MALSNNDTGASANSKALAPLPLCNLNQAAAPPKTAHKAPAPATRVRAGPNRGLTMPKPRDTIITSIRASARLHTETISAKVKAGMLKYLKM